MSFKNINTNQYSQRLSRLVDLFNEAGMLRKIPRSGFPFLGSGSENVAEHSYRVSIIGYVLARLAGIDPARVCYLCLFHDLHEARTGDFNYVNHRYDTCDALAAIKDATRGTGLEEEILSYWKELEDRESLESQLAHDADQLDLICNLQTELHRGNDFARDWLDSALKRLRTSWGRDIADSILRSSPQRWWYDMVEKDWWIHHGEDK